MNVKDLIKKLKEFDGETDVYVSDNIDVFCINNIVDKKNDNGICIEVEQL